MNDKGRYHSEALAECRFWYSHTNNITQETKPPQLTVADAHSSAAPIGFE
jgi:hypothetical protein